MCTAEAAPVSDSEVESFFHDLETVPALVLAVSGGPDSTALMVLAARWRERLKSGPTLTAVTIDHGLRAESAREAAAVGRLAHQLGLAHRTLRWTGKKPSTGLQEAARTARYRLLAKAARETGAAHILTAHTLDDQAETVLIRLTRGSGLTGLGGMGKVSALPTTGRSPSPHPNSGLPEFGTSNGRSRIYPTSTGEGWGEGARASRSAPPPPTSLRSVDLSPLGRGERAASPELLLVIRPLLDVPKARLIATLRAAKIPFADDPSNRDPRFTRARLRGLMPALAEEGLDARRLALLARRLKRADATIEAAVDRAEALLPARGRERARICGEAAIILDAQDFAALPAEVGLRLLGRAVAAVGDEGPVELAKLEVLKEALDCAQNAHASRFRRSLAGAMVTLRHGGIFVEPAPPRRSGKVTSGKIARSRLPPSR